MKLPKIAVMSINIIVSVFIILFLITIIFIQIKISIYNHDRIKYITNFPHKNLVNFVTKKMVIKNPRFMYPLYDQLLTQTAFGNSWDNEAYARFYCIKSIKQIE